MKKTTVLSFKVEPGLKLALEYLARQENRSLSNYVQTLLLRHLDERGINPKEFESADKSE